MFFEFAKMHGLGNDFVIADASFFEGRDLCADAVAVCDRHRGVGADGLILFGMEGGTPFMRLWNSDGSRAKMCGNGIRCLARLLFERGLSKSPGFVISTDSGPRSVFVDEKSGDVGVDMGNPDFLPANVPVSAEGDSFVEGEIESGGRIWRVTAVSMGNPHAVIFVDSLDDSLLSFGAGIERHPIFPDGVNVEFVKAVDPRRLRVLVWERGAGPTMACGTGACAAYAVACRLGKCTLYADVELPGGVLRISTGNSGSVQMRGPAVKSFEGRMEI